MQSILWNMQQSEDLEFCHKFAITNSSASNT